MTQRDAVDMPPVFPRLGPNRVVAKVGGSLFSWAGFPAALADWLDRRPEAGGLLLAGGGAAADLVRDWSARFPLSDHASHWLAVRAMGLQARLLLELVPNLTWADTLADAREKLDAGARWVVLDPTADLRGPLGAGLPVGWHVTSDAIAGFLARRLEVGRLHLLKSVGGDNDLSAAQARDNGWLDADFANRVGAVPCAWVNLRTGRSVELTV